MKAWIESVLGAATAGALLTCLGAVPAQAADVISAGDAQIAGRGTDLRGTYTLDCDFAGQVISSRVDVIQNKSGRITSGGTFVDFICESDGQVTVAYLVFAEGNRYIPGTATLRVLAIYTDESGFFTDPAIEKEFAIQIRNFRQPEA